VSRSAQPVNSAKAACSASKLAQEAAIRAASAGPAGRAAALDGDLMACTAGAAEIGGGKGLAARRRSCGASRQIFVGAPFDLQGDLGGQGVQRVHRLISDAARTLRKGIALLIRGKG